MLGTKSVDYQVINIIASDYRVVDMERGFFNFIQSGQIAYAEQL